MENAAAARPWRILFDGAHSGARNMATDEALARAHLEADSQTPPTLRFYDWEPRCLSIGRVQRLDGPLQVLAERREGVDWVRRPSGGRAVWHEADVTYSITLALDDLPAEARSIVGAYEWLSRPLLRGLESLGVRAEIAPARAHDKHERNCFLSASQADAVVDGRKLIGGAQCRFEADGRAAVLQHGSILIAMDARSWARALGEQSLEDRVQQMEQRMLALRDAGVQGDIAEIRARARQAISHALIEERGAEPGQLSIREAAARDELEAHKYLARSWNHRGRVERALGASGG